MVSVCKTTGCEDECARWHWQSGSGVQGAGTVEIELLSQGTIEPGESAHRKEVLELSGKHPRYGYRRITALMRRDGFEVMGNASRGFDEKKESK